MHIDIDFGKGALQNEASSAPYLLWRKQKDFDGQVLKITETVENGYKLSTNYQASAFLRRLFFMIFT